MMPKTIFKIIALIFLFNKAIAQDTTKLNVGDKAPSLVLPTVFNTIQSFNFPYKNKIMLVFFWSSSVSSSHENLFKYSKINARYSGLEYRACEGFEVISVALQSDRIAWEEDLKKHNMLKVNNCIALKGYKDYFIKPYKLQQTPTSFLIDEFGKIVYVNPDIPTIMGYLDERKNVINKTDLQNKIAGKIVIGNDVKPLKNSKVFILNEKKDTLQTVLTNEAGIFYLNNISSSQNVNINILNSNQIKEDDKVYLASENGEILSGFTKTETGFEYKLLGVEMTYLKPLKENELVLKTTKELTNLNFTENLHKNGGVDLSNDSKEKLDVLVAKLKMNPKAKVEITSHTDSKGDNKLNLTLSLKRAIIIEKYFTLKGIDKNRIKAIGKGETELLNKCTDGVTCSEEENNMNRRTVFRFYQTDN